MGLFCHFGEGVHNDDVGGSWGVYWATGHCGWALGAGADETVDLLYPVLKCFLNSDVDI